MKLTRQGRSKGAGTARKKSEVTAIPLVGDSVSKTQGGSVELRLMCAVMRCARSGKGVPLVKCVEITPTAPTSEIWRG